MIKKTIACLMCAVSSQSFAAGTDGNNKHFSMFSFQGEKAYVGAALGIRNLQIGSRGYASNVDSSLRLFLGSGALYGEDNRIYLGKEINVDVFHLPRSSRESNAVDIGLGASFMPGYYVADNVMLYGRAGLEALHSQHSSVLTTQLGVGMQYDVTKNVNLKLEYTSFGATNYFDEPNSQVGLGISYKFD